MSSLDFTERELSAEDGVVRIVYRIELKNDGYMAVSLELENVVAATFHCHLQEKAKVMIGVSINEEGHPQYLKMEVVADLKEDTVMQFAQKHVKDGSTISSDAYRSYPDFRSVMY